MRPPEWIALVYFGYIAATVALGPFQKNRTRVLARTVAVLLLIVALGAADTREVQRVRDWMPALYAVFGYWLPGMLVTTPHAGLEQRLVRSDEPLRPIIDRFVSRAPRMLLEYFELAYLCCYPLVPFAFLWLAMHGWVAAADRYWTAVLLALYPCYGVVPWLPTRPPRAIEAPIAMDRRRLPVRRLNLRIVQKVSIQTNTFPSGHTAAALAAAAVVMTMMPISGAVIGGVAISIAVASVIGRYHYAADAVAGAAVAVAAVVCAAWWFGAGAG